MKEIVGVASKVGDDSFQDTVFGDIQELIDTTPEGLAKDDLMEMSASEPVPDEEEEDLEAAVRENKLTLDKLAEGFQLFKTAFDLLLHMDPSMIWAQKQKQMVGEKLVLYRNIFRNVKKQKRQITVFSYKVTRGVPPPHLPFHPLHFRLCSPHVSVQDPSLLLLHPPLSLFNMKTVRMKTFMMNHLTNNKYSCCIVKKVLYMCVCLRVKI